MEGYRILVFILIGIQVKGAPLKVLNYDALINRKLFQLYELIKKDIKVNYEKQTEKLQSNTESVFVSNKKQTVQYKEPGNKEFEQYTNKIGKNDKLLHGIIRILEDTKNKQKELDQSVRNNAEERTDVQKDNKETGRGYAIGNDDDMLDSIMQILRDKKLNKKELDPTQLPCMERNSEGKCIRRCQRGLWCSSYRKLF